VYLCLHMMLVHSFCLDFSECIHIRTIVIILVLPIFVGAVDSVGSIRLHIVILIDGQHQWWYDSSFLISIYFSFNSCTTITVTHRLLNISIVLGLFVDIAADEVIRVTWPIDLR
jgi:hypothetical protein